MLRCQIRHEDPPLSALLAEYDRLVAYVESVEPGFSVYMLLHGYGLFRAPPVDAPPADAAVVAAAAAGVVPNGHRIRPAWGGAPARVVPVYPADENAWGREIVDLMDDDDETQQASGESSSETARRDAEVVRRAEEIIDLTLND